MTQNNMTDSSVNNKRIAKNTLFLYFRMIIIMLVTLYTSRVILRTLGVEDYGIYNVVGGIATFLNFICGSLNVATQRFITFEIGKGYCGNISKVFSTSIQLHIILALIIAIIAEPIGVWFILNKLVIPEEKISSALWVFHFSILTMIVVFISVPYNSLIVAYEKMNIFALVSIIEALLKLGVAGLIVFYNSSEKLILYGLSIFVVQLIIRACYACYCNKNLPKCKYVRCWDWFLTKEMMSLASWSIFGNLTFMLYTQGLNVLLGMFFMPFVNAARGIAVQIQSAINSFVQNFQTALNPQITKSYAAGELGEMHSLIFRSSRLSFYLLMIFSVPILLQTSTLLSLWLNTVPTYTISFTIIMVLTTWITSVANPLEVAVKATGNIKKYESLIGGIMILILPISFLCLKLGCKPIAVFFVHLIAECIAMIFRIYISHNLIKFSYKSYVRFVLKPIMQTLLLAIIIPTVISVQMASSILSVIVVTLISGFCSVASIYCVGLTNGEKIFFNNKIRTIIKNN